MGDDTSLGLVSGVACDSNDQVYVYNRSPVPAMLVFDPDGTLVAEWGKDIFQKPHGIWISPDDEIYTTDTIDHTVRKFSLDGELLQTFEPYINLEPQEHPSTNLHVQCLLHLVRCMSQMGTDNHAYTV